MLQPILMLGVISALGLLTVLGAIYNWGWISRSAGARLRTTLIGRPAMRILTGITGVIFIIGPWVVLLTRP